MAVYEHRDQREKIQQKKKSNALCFQTISSILLALYALFGLIHNSCKCDGLYKLAQKTKTYKAIVSFFSLFIFGVLLESHA